MADRRVKVVFSAEIQGFKKAMEEAASSTSKVKKASEEAGKATQKNADELAKAAAAHQAAAKAVGFQYDKTGQLIDANGKSLSSQQAAAHGLQSFSKEAYLAGHAADAAATANAKADTTLQKIAKSADQNRDAWEKNGTALLGFGTAAVGGLALAGKAAIDWESAWAGVNKTVNGSPEQMAALEKELRGLAKTLPATHEEIAGVAEAAGQLGIQRGSVAAFTKTMIDLGESTNLSADEAATGLARFSNVMGTSQDDVSRLGSTLVGLGNNFATTEAEILSMSMRLAGAGKQAGLSEGDVMGIATAMSSVGIEAEAGGSAMSTTMKRIGKAARDGGSDLDLFAKTSGMTSDEFSKAWGEDAAGTLVKFVGGLGKTAEAGGSVNAVLDELGIKGIREADSLLRLSSASGVLTDSLEVGNEAFKTNTALAEEAAKRYETTESKVKIAWNNIKDAAIDAGAVLLPAVAAVAESVAGLAQTFGSLPGPVKGVLSVLGSVVGVAALGAGAFLTLTPRILSSITAFQQLVPAGSRAAGVLGKVGKVAGIAGGFAVLATTLGKLAEADYMSKIDTGMGRVSLALADVANTAPGASTALDGLFKDREGGDLINTVTDLESAIRRTFNRDAGQQFNDWGEAVANGLTGIKGSSQILQDQFKSLDAGLSDLVSSGKADDAAKAFDNIKRAAADQGVSVEELVELFPQYGDALKQAEADAKNAAGGADEAAGAIEGAGDAGDAAADPTAAMAEALAEVGVAADGTIFDLDKFQEALLRATGANLSARDAARGYEGAIDAIAESVTANGTSLDINTEKGRKNQAALDAIAGAGMKVVEANARNSESQETLQGNLGTTYQDLINAAGAFGITGQEAIDLARDILNVPKDVNIDTWMSDQAKLMADSTKAAIDRIPGFKNVAINVQYTETGTAIRDRATDAGMSNMAQGFATGGRLPAFSGGGQLPTTGPGTGMTDGFLGVDSLGVPRARVDAGEWIINGNSSNRYNRELAAINAGTFPKLPGFAGGGREFAAQSFTSSGHGAVSVSAPAVTVMIGNEQLDARTYRVASAAISAADSQSQFSRRGR